MRRRIWRGWILCLCACLLLCGAASGTGSTPPDAVSRGAFADALYDAHVAHGGAPVVSEGSSAPFRDVGSWSPYFEALCWAKASGIAGGYAGGAFRPAAPVTRQQATVMLYRYAKTTDLPLEKGSDRDLAGYRDVDTIPTWSREAVQWAVRNGLWFSGSATELQAAENVSWEELTVLTQRLFLGGMPAAALSAAPEGLTMELQQCTTTGAVVVLQNAAEETFSYGADYGLYRQVNGGWDWQNAATFLDDGDATGGLLTPGRKTRELTLDGILEGESGYMMLQVFAVTGSEVILCSERLLAVRPAAVEPSVTLSAENAEFDASARRELVLEARINVPAEITVCIYDAQGKLVRRLASAQLTRPAPGDVTRLYWDGRNDAGERVPAGAYAAALETVIGGERQKATVDITVR